MSANEIPVLDPKNLVYVEPDLALGMRFIYDPIAKLRLSAERSSRTNTDYGSNRMTMYYCPEYSPDLFSNPITEEDWQDLGKIRRDFSIEVAYVQVDYNIRDGVFLAIVDTDAIFGIGILRNDAHYRPDIGTWKASDPRFKFWPDGASDKHKIIASYFLSYVSLLVREDVSWGRKEQIRGELLSHCGIATSNALAEYIGVQHFPDAEPMDDGLILILKKDVANAC